MMTVSNDNDFEVLIDPDGCNHWYKKLEINALAQTRDLMMDKPYIDGGMASTTWDMVSLKFATYINGSINDPSGSSNFWTVELALPLRDCVENSMTAQAPPKNGDQWRINFARVEWEVRVFWDERNNDSSFYKLPDVKDIWVWSPQGATNMHLPERWGFVQFSTGVPNSPQPFEVHSEEWNLRTVLAQVYYAERKSLVVNGYYTGDITKLELPGYVLDGSLHTKRPEIVQLHQGGLFNVSVSYDWESSNDGQQTHSVGVGHISHDRLIWFTPESDPIFD